MQPVQDLTVENRVSRTQFQYSMEDADANELANWSPQLLEKLKTMPELRDVASDQLNGGLQANLMIDRDTASRFGILPQNIDDTLYDAFGQRQVSTIFTQLNQYHVVLEVNPQFRRTPDALKSIYVKSSSGTSSAGRTAAGISGPNTSSASPPVATGPSSQVPLMSFTRLQRTMRRWRSITWASSPR